METEAARSRDDGAALAVLALVARELTQLFTSVEKVDWDRPTPCTEWTLRDLTEHVTGGNRFTFRILSGDATDNAMAFARRSFVEDHDTREGLVTSTLELNDHFVVPGALDATCHHINGDMSGHDVLRLRLHDLIIHTWDAAQALHATPFQIRAELLSWALADLAYDTFAERHFRLEPPSPATEPKTQETLLAAFGRRIP